MKIIFFYRQIRKLKIHNVLLLIILMVSFAFAQTANDYLARGNEYLGKKEHDLAITNYTKAIELSPRVGKFYNFGVGLTSGKGNMI